MGSLIAPIKEFNCLQIFPKEIWEKILSSVKINNYNSVCKIFNNIAEKLPRIVHMKPDLIKSYINQKIFPEEINFIWIKGDENSILYKFCN